MSIERLWEAVPAQIIAQNGPSLGSFKINGGTCGGFRVGMLVVFKGNTLPDLELKVKRISKDGTIFVGDKDTDIRRYSDISAYTVLLNSTVESPEQTKAPIPFEQHELAAFEREPVNAKRVLAVDDCGNAFGGNNPLPVSFGGTVGTPEIFNIPANVAGTEYTILIPSTSKRYEFRARGNAKIQYAFKSGDTNIKYMTLFAGNPKSEDNLKLNSNLIIYFQTNKANETIEVLIWE
jgi:hypothetical protein